ncbi:MAG TPA: PPK2 family polyphosphate kinase [Ktedonobacteraceae bacterium]|nr:PPK2 family polyphosphate kinase [Ktedonobacteraceae bacterium]
MAPDLLWKVKEGTNVKLNDYDPNYIDKTVQRDSAVSELRRLGDELNELQEIMQAAQHHSLLMILQGMDTSGKDGTIRHVLGRVNPQGCFVHAFKAPTDEELAHDFLWRVHSCTPGKGSLGIFNRSHYEDVLVARVHNLVPEAVWSRRYKEINNFEKLLAADNTIILKFFLHISFDEQERRLLERERDKDKAWKITADDWIDRKYWDDYQRAYEDALRKCSSDDSPWYIVPANHKWYRNLSIAQVLVETMRRYKNEWTVELELRGQRELEKLRKVREGTQP